MIVSLSVLLVAGLALAIVVAAARDRSPAADPGIGTPRRFFLYALALIGLVAAANGAAWLLQAAVGALVGDAALTSDSTIALGVSLVGVGLPAWAAFWGGAQRTVRANPHEATFLLRKLYLYGLLVGAAATAAVAAAQFLAALLGIEGRSPVASGSVLLAWAAVWAYHAAVERREPPTTEVGRLLRALHVYVLAVSALAVLAVALGDVLRDVLRKAYDALVGRTSLWATTPWASLALRTSGSNALVGALVWWWFGHRQARPGRDGWPRDVALYAFGVFPGAVVVLSAASVLLYRALQVAFGAGAAVEEFAVLPNVLAALVVGGGLWGFHTARARADEALDPERGRAGRRANAYLLAAVGLVGVAVGLVQALSAAVGALAPATATLVGGALRDAAILAATLLAVAGPLWGATWARLQRLARADPEVERPATSRRLYLTLAFGVGVAVALVAATVVVYEVVVAILDGRGLAVLWTVRGSLATALVAAAVGGYHGALLREERAAGVTRPRARPEAVVVRPGDVVVTRVPRTGPGALAGVVYALDVARLAAFYADVAELRSTDVGDGSAHLTAPGVDLFLVAIPAGIAAGIEVTSPPQRREETPIKLAFPTSDLERARTAAAARGGVVDPPERAWSFGGYLHCDGHDPEGNVFQLREAVG